ncbi:MAG: pirin family protein [Nanoarchaeota archaeon]|nr:pirin family protein [Nanoarchaeota archaeon]
MRKIQKKITPKIIMEGAGVKLRRVFGPEQSSQFDPFLLFDHFGSADPDDYLKGFPWHPHRGIETVTYLLQGEVAHADSIGNKGVIKSGEIQWMTAGSGIIHQEMPQPFKGEMQGFQLWVNLPKAKKMTAPQYRGIAKDELVVVKLDGAAIKIVAGKIGNKQGPVHHLSTEVEYFEIDLSGTFKYDTKKKTVLIYVIEGSLQVGNESLNHHQAALLEEKGDIVISAEKARFLLIAGDPLREPVAWSGPIVMNTQKELQEAFQELENGTFIKTKLKK